MSLVEQSADERLRRVRRYCTKRIEEIAQNRT